MVQRCTKLYLGAQYGFHLRSIRSRQSSLLLQFLSSSVWCNTRSKHNLLDIPLLSKSHHILSTTDIRLKILMILMSWSTMNSSKVEDDIILSRSKRQVLEKLADIILNESRCHFLSLTQSRLVILHHRVRSTSPYRCRGYIPERQDNAP